MKVTLIQPPSVYLLDSKAMPPLGILYLAAWLRKHGHEVSIIDLAGVPDWRAEISREQSKLDGTDWVGLTCTTPQYYDSMKIRDNIRARGYDMPVTVGGIHLTSLAHNNEMDFLDDGFDAYCVGEGYNAVTKMCVDLKSGGLNKLYAEPILKDVNDLPFAARDLIDIRGYRYKLGDTPTTSHYSQYGCVYGCLSAETLITLANRTKVRLDQIRVGDYLLNTQGSKSRVIAKAKTPEKQAYELELTTGQKIVGSADHPVLTRRGWITISQLTENDEVYVDSAEQSSGNLHGSSTTKDTLTGSAPPPVKTNHRSNDSQVKSVKKLDGLVQSFLDISCDPVPSFIANGMGVHNCTYCESPLSGSFTVRAMSAERIVAEVKQVRNDFGIYGATFFDDEMNLSKSRMLAICDGFRRLGDVVWRGFMVTGKWDRELADACKSSGCYEVATGIESGSPAILRNIRKPATVELNRAFIRSAKKAGLRVKTFMIIGLPGESWQTVRETDAFLEGLRAEGCAPDDVDFSILQVYPGAPIYQNPIDVTFTKDYEHAYYKSTPGEYGDLIQVQTAGMAKADLVAARNYLEEKYKPAGWVKDHIDRKDLDRVMASIQYAKDRMSNGGR